MKIHRLLAELLTVLLLGACAPFSRTSPIATPTLRSTLPVPVATAPSAQPTLTRHQRVAQQAVLDLAQRVNLDAAIIQIESIQADEFPAGDLGCPQPDGTAAAMPAFVTGQRITLRAGNAHYEYRAAGTQLIYCGVLSTP
jgi:hypothetical protein